MNSSFTEKAEKLKLGGLMAEVQIIEVRNLLQGLVIRQRSPKKQRDVERFQQLVGDLIRTIYEDGGLAVGSDEYEEFTTDFGRIDFRNFESSEFLSPSGVRLLGRVEDLLEQFEQDPLISVTREGQ
jgi:hypothetical protein